MIKKDCNDRNYYNDVSSIVNDGIEEVLYLLKKDLTSIKTIKSDSLHRCFYGHKKHKALNERLFFILDVFMLTKSMKSIKLSTNDFIKSIKSTWANKKLS